MSKENLIGVYLSKDDEDLRQATKGMTNAAKADITKKALRLYFAQHRFADAAPTAKPWTAKGATK